MGIYSQKSFVDGMDLISKDTDISPNGYKLGINTRVRYGYMESIKASRDITYNLSVAGKFQGVYGVGAVWIAFYSGQAWFMPVNGTIWVRIANLQLDTDVDYIYAEAVPAPNANFLRKAIVTAGNPDAAAGIIKDSSFSSFGSPAGLVCQDGINQPWLIMYDPINNIAIARVLGTYNEWDNTGLILSNDREYVPIGKQMMYLDGILYIVNGATIYRSVSGRPLDFMVNVDPDGNKLSTESLGGARSVSFAVSFGDITAIRPSVTSEGIFLIGTSTFIYGMAPTFDKTIFGEPTFIKAFQLEAGVVNHFSFTDSNGDTPFIDYEAVKFFNSVKQLKWEGNNDPLSKNISKLLIGITQNVCCCIEADNYNFFGLKTIYGYCNAVFDNMSQKWVGIDITNASAYGTKMFAVATLINARYLASGNLQNKIFLMFIEDTRESATLFPRAFVSGSYSQFGNFVPSPLVTQHKTSLVKVNLEQGKLDGTLYCREVVDEKRGQILTKDITGVISGIPWPVQPPVVADESTRIDDIAFSYEKGITGYKIAPILVWNNDILVLGFDLETKDLVSRQSEKRQQSEIFQNG